MNCLLVPVCIILFLLTILVIYKIILLKNIVFKKQDTLSDKKILIIYYSHGGNTKRVVQNLHAIVDGDLKEVNIIEKYPNNIFKMSKLVRKQMKESFLPEIEEVDISGYDVIFVGCPIWGFSMSLPMTSFLKNNNFENKTIIPFFTCSGGVIKRKVINELESSTNSKEILPPLFMFENGFFLVKEQIARWLNKIL